MHVLHLLDTGYTRFFSKENKKLNGVYPERGIIYGYSFGGGDLDQYRGICQKTESDAWYCN